MNIEESIKILEKFITEHKLFNIKHNDGLEEAIETLLTAYEKEKRLAEANLKDSKEFQDNMCNHRCILNSKVMELEAELEKEKETSHYNQSQLDIVNAKLIEEKEKNSKLLEALDTVNHEKGVFIESYEKEKEKNKILLQCLKDSQERCENEHLFLGNPDM